MEFQSLIDAVIAAGATKAAVISQDQIVLSDSFRAICESNQCGNFGRCWMCPPYAGEIHELMDRVRTFPRGILYQSIAEIEDSYDIEGMFAAGDEHAKLSQKIDPIVKTMLKKPMLHLSCGGCHVCPVCAKKTNEPCRHPDKALSSLEAYGIDVYMTTKDTPLKYINGENTVTYFGLILFSE